MSDFECLIHCCLQSLGLAENQSCVLSYLSLDGQAPLPGLVLYTFLSLRRKDFAPPSQAPFVYFRLRKGGEFARVVDLIRDKKVNEKILENGDKAALGKNGAKWDICISVSYYTGISAHLTLHVDTGYRRISPAEKGGHARISGPEGSSHSQVLVGRGQHIPLSF